MADVDKKVKVTMEAQDNTGAAFSSLGKNIGAVQTSSNNLGSALTKLGALGAGLYAGSKLLSFFSDATKLAMEDMEMTDQLTAAMGRLGLAASMPELDLFISKMSKLGQAGSDTSKGLTQLIQATKSTNEAVYLSKLASDLAASGMGDYNSNVDALSSLFLGRFKQAATQFGINIKENSNAVEILNEIEKKVTRTTEEMADTTVGRVKAMSNAWEELKGRVGTFALGVFNATEGILGLLESWKNFCKGLFGIGKEAEKAVDAQIKKSEELGEAEAERHAAQLKDADEQKSANDKVAESFRTLSKNIINSFDQQEKAISDLRKAMRELDEQLGDQISKSDERFKEDVKNAARSAKERIEGIDKQIASEESSRSAGFRTRISELEKEKAKEQAIIDKAGGFVTGINEEISKDAIDILREQHEKEIKEIQGQAEKKRLELQKEELERQKFLLESKISISKPGFFESATGEAGTFLGNIGGGAVQNSFVFNFNGDVSDIETLKKAVIGALDRQATLKGVGGK